MKKIIFILLYFIFSRPVLAVDVGQYDVFEDTITHAQPANPWEDAGGSHITAKIIAPSKTYTIDGFYYDTNTYKIRFTPAELGQYNYEINWGTTLVKSGAFNSVLSTNRGFIRQSQANNHRFVFEDGSFFNGVGINDCWGTPDQPQWFLKAYTDETTDPNNEDMFLVDPDTYFRTYSQAGFNLFRWGSDNCSFGIWGMNGGSGNTYNVANGKSADLLLSTAKKYGFHTIFNFWWGAPTTSTSDTVTKRAVRYALARYGAYTDVWEFTNEQDSTVPGLVNWLSYHTNWLKTYDPYQRIITNSFPMLNDWTYLTARSPHEDFADVYPGNSGYRCATSLASSRQCDPNTYFQTKIPVIMGEVYSPTGCNWSPQNGLVVRSQTWTSNISGAALVWWNSSYARDNCGGTPNQYLGFDERKYVKIAQDLFRTMDKDAQMETLTLSNSTLTGYKLGGPSQILIYIFKNWNDSTVNKSTSFQTNIPFAGKADWIKPSTGEVLSSPTVMVGNNSFTTPSFSEDVALRIYSNTTPVAGDLNGDGKVDILDFRLAIKDLASILNLNSLIANFGK